MTDPINTPVYYPLEGVYYQNDKPCKHLSNMGFVAHIPKNPQITWSKPCLFASKWYEAKRFKKTTDNQSLGGF